MKKTCCTSLSSILIAVAIAGCAPLRAQTVNASQQVTVQGLRSVASHGSFTAAAYGPNGSLYLLLDQHDGVRILKADAAGTNVLAQAQAGSNGDVGVSMAIDASGNVYVTGTTSSGALSATAGAAFPTAADTTTNSFLAKYDTNLNLVFLTFLGAGRTAAASVAANADGTFITGITYSTTFPVTSAGIQQTPASGSSENGFVERFSTSGALVYATYLTGLNGNTAPTAIAADSSDNAYVTGSTTSSGFPTIAALEPAILGTTSGFLTRLAPAGNVFAFSTFIAGTGLTSMALDAASSSLLLTGNVSLGQFPVATVATPLSATSYQTLLRIPLDGQSVSDSVLLVPGSQSFVTAGPNKTAWIAGALTTPLFPGATPPDYAAGDSFLLHLAANDTIDQTLRFGGLAANNVSYASLISTAAAPAVSSDGATAAFVGSVTASMSSSLLSTQRFDLPMAATPDNLLPNTLRDIVPTATACGSQSQCSGSGALLAFVSTSAAAPSLSLSIDTLPNVTLRNLGSASANGLIVTASGFTVVSNCGATLAASSQCSLALTGSGPGSLTVSAANAPSYTMTLPANTLTPDPLALSTDEVDFGIVTSTSPAATRTATITNLTTASQTFSAAKDGGAANSPYTIVVASSDCATTGAANTFTIAASASCHLTFSLTASNSSANDGAIRSTWKVGTRDVVLTAFAQAASLNVSATEVDFGTQFTGASAIRLPRYLYLSNNSSTAIGHTTATLPTAAPFAVADRCPSTLEPHSVCQLALSYVSTAAPSNDAVTLNLDQGLSVLLTGSTLQPASVTGTSSNPSLSVAPATINFATPVVVTGVSTGTQTVTVTNGGANAFALAISVSGDFTLTNGCTSTLPTSASCQVLVSFAPSQPGTRQGVMSVTAGSGFAPTYVALSGSVLAILPTNNGTLDLGQTLVGEPAVVWYRVQQALTSLTATTGSSQFGVMLVANTGAVPAGLAPSAFAQTATAACNACYLGVQFLGETPGVASSTLTLSTVAAGNAYPLTLTATALPVQGLLLTPITQDFGPVAINSSSAPITFTLANLLTPSAATTIQSVTATGDFVITANTTGGAACSGSLAATASCFVQVAFAPSGTGPRSGTLTVVTSSGTATAALTGYGLPDPGIAINSESLSFQSVPGSAATQQIVTISNTGSATAMVGSVTASDASFSTNSACATLAPGAMCNITITFAPQTAPITATLSIPATTTLNGQTSTSTYSVALAGVTTTQTAGLEILPAVANFGSTAAGSLGPTRQFTLNNLSGKALNVTLEMPRQFVLASSAPCPALAAGASCTFAASFVPATAGAITGTIFAQGLPTDGSTAVESLSYLLGYGSSASQISVTGNPVPGAPLSFGQVTSGQSVQKTLTLTNSGSSSLTVRRMTSEPPFLAITNCGATLAIAASCSVTITYAPVYEVASGSSAGPRNDAGTLVIESDSASSPDIVDLSGVAGAIVSSNPSGSAVIAALDVSQGSLTFPATAVGSASNAQTVTLTNSGTTTVHVLSVLAPQDFAVTTTCSTLLPGATCSVGVQFTPGNASQANVRSGAVEIQSDAGTALEFVSVAGSASSASITLSPTSLGFGTVKVGANAVLGLTVTNNGTASVTFQSLSASGDYSVAQGTCPPSGATLAAGASCRLSVTFAPTAAGARGGTLSLATDATALPLTVALSGNGVVPQLQASPATLAFGSVGIGSTASLTLTLTNAGSSTLTGIGGAISGANAADFSVSTPCSTTVLTANSSCTLTVTFSPAATGSRTATLTLNSSDPAGPVTVTLTGTGTQPPSFVLTVNGASAATATVMSGTPAAYPLVLTPLNGFTGAVALTCAPVTSAPYASCSVLASTLTLNGSAQSSTATINTVTSSSTGMIAAIVGLIGAPFVAMVAVKRPRRKRRATAAMVAIGMLLCVSITSCGGKGQPSSSKLLYTPAGTYQYQVTATSTSGAQVTSTVTLNLIVQ
jgi:hypothetical protein